MLRLALYQPDIPQNTGAMLRLGACLGVGIDIIEPCGFVFTDRGLKRSALDYAAHADVSRHIDWHAFRSVTSPRRLVLLSTKADRSYLDHEFTTSDTLLLGRESGGVPQEVHEAASARLRIPIREPTRSLNVALAAAMALGEALRQINGFPTSPRNSRPSPAKAGDP